MDMNALKTSLECSLCLSLICEPISISCGHSFCRVCLVKSLTRHKKKCPSCREVCHVAAESAAENIMIKALSQQLDPDLYAARSAEFQAEKQSWNTLYKLMMQRVVNSNRAFAYVPNFSNYSAAIGDIALVAELKEVEFLSDGRCLLEASLGSRQRVIDHYVEEGTQGLHFCRLESYADTPVNEANAVAQLNQMKEDAQTLVRSFLERHAGVHIENLFGPPPTSVEGYSLWLSAVVPLSSTDKYDLLVSRNTAHRLERCISCLRDIETRYNRRAAVINAASSVASTAAQRGLEAWRNIASFVMNNATLPENIYDDYEGSGSGGNESESEGDDDLLDPDAELPNQRSGSTGTGGADVSQLTDALHDTSFHEEEDGDENYVDLEFSPDTESSAANIQAAAQNESSVSPGGDLIDVDLASNPSPLPSPLNSSTTVNEFAATNNE